MPVPGEEEVALVLARPDTSRPTGVRDRALLETAYGTAARLQELTRLRVGDLDLRGGTVRLLGKGNRERVAPLGRQAVQWLGRYLREARPALLRNRESEALWIGRSGRALGYAAVRTVLRVHSRGAVSPHGLRRACATHMLRAGAHPVQIQALLGHASLRSLRHYLKVTIAELAAMHAASRLGS